MKIKRADKLTNRNWLNMFDVAYIDAQGGQKSWEIVTRSNEPKCITGKYDMPDAVVIVPFHRPENKLVLTREYRIPLADFEIGFPAGLIDPGETVEQATRRELHEETGLQVTRFLKISPALYSSAGMTDESIAMVYVECAGEPSTDGNRGAELINVQFVSPSQASKLCDQPTLKFDAKAWLVLARYAEKGTIE